MTDTIPPCPVIGCGVIPEMLSINGGRHKTYLEILCGHHDYKTPSMYEWKRKCDAILGRALRTHGIHTIQQLTERLAQTKEKV